MYSDMMEEEKVLLRKAAKNIRSHPEKYNQNSFGTNTPDQSKASDCGSACCIAGHILLVAGWTPIKNGNGQYHSPTGVTSMYASSAAKSQFGPHVRGVIAETHLFGDVETIEWPEEYKDRFEEADQDGDPKEMAAVAADLLEAIADGRVR